VNEITAVNRIAAKLLLADPGALDLETLIPVFHGWIREAVVPGMLIDVADYRHVPDGPGVILIGHDWDRSVDQDLGRTGVLSIAKRDHAGDLSARIRAVVADALRTADILADPEWAGPAAAVRTDGVEVTILDRVSAPNTDAAHAALDGVVLEALSPLGPASGVERVGDARRPFRLRIALPGSAGAAPAELAERLAPATAGV
jgi:hypothetical protein